ncbi:hypothetical protein GCM10025762_43680 [Haloechinothrix salitolerans]|uniref:MlaD family protein n=1 Tax=Haloechinothrix salitolerans TaxID=926830 RepID=UPI0031ECB742
MVVLATLLGGTGAAAGIGKSADAGGDMTVVAEFEDASPLVVGNQVKLDGVVVGTVESIEARRNKAAVAMKLDRSAQPLHQDAQAIIRPVTILGERFVDLDRGTPSAPLLSTGAVLPASQTRQATDLDEVLNMVDEPTGKSLAALVTTLGQGMQGRGKDAADAIAVLESAMRDTDGLVEVLKEHTRLLNDLVSTAQPVADALAADDGETLDRLVGSIHRVVQSTSQKDEALDAVLSQLPATLSEARATLGRLAGTSEATTPVLAGLRPTTDNLNAISEELREFSRTAQPALASAEPVLAHAEELLNQARPVVAEMRKAGKDLKGTASAAKPLVARLTGNIENVLNFFRYWAMATNGWDGLSHYFRGMVIINPQQITGLLPKTSATELTGAKGEKPPPKRNNERAVWQQLPELQGGVSGLLDSSRPSSRDGGVTGLSQQQEGRALDFLLGGSR